MSSEVREALDAAARAEIRLRGIYVERERCPEDDFDYEGERAAQVERSNAMAAYTNALLRDGCRNITDAGFRVLERALALSIAQTESIISS